MSGFFGNQGQTDYSLANEVLNKFAYNYSKLNPTCFVRSINWGPWDSGMVDETLKSLYKKLNIEIIPVSIGVNYLVNELERGDLSTTQVLVNGENAPDTSDISNINFN